MLHEIHQQSYILPHMSQLNPKYFWIPLTSLENTLMLIFKHEVKIFSILFNFKTNGISHITFFDIWCRNNIILQKNYKKSKKKVCPKGELNRGPWDLKTSVLTNELLCHYIEIGKKNFEYSFLCKMRKSQFSQQDVSWFHKLWWFWIWFCMRHKWLLQSFNGALIFAFFSLISQLDVSWLKK